MAEEISRTSHGDAPLSSAKHPDAQALVEAEDGETGDTIIGRTVTINRPRAELYAFWRDLENLPKFMENVQSVVSQSATRSHWVVLASAGRTAEWDAEITDEIPDERISWCSVEPANVRNSGSVTFRDSPTGRGTVVTVRLAYEAPGGAVGKAVATLLRRSPALQVRQDLRRFKQLMETGEISTAKPPSAAPRA
jgi:uncharacterized membrane protein